MNRSLSGLVVLLVAAHGHAHHSDAALDTSRVVTFAGVVTEYWLRNPHSYFVVETTGETGETVSWEVQMGSALSMSRRGWTRETLLVGDHVIASIYPARDGRPYGLFASLEKGGESISYERLPRPAVQPRTATLEGVWITDRASLGPDYPGGLDELTRRELTLTEKARAAYESFDPESLDNPELSCITKPTPGGLTYTDTYPMEIEFVEEEQLVMIRVQYFDQERTVYMDGRGHPPADQRTHEGHSIGWWEGDVLVVDTTNFADDRSPYQNGIPSGALKHVVERYRLHEDGTRMTLEFTLEDPEYIVGSMSHRRELRYSPHMTMTPFNCDLESTRRYLPR